MKIIDEQGKLFGKINIIDFTALFLLLCIIPMSYIGYRILSRIPEIKREFITTDIDCRLIKIIPDVARFISVGDKEVNEDGEVIGEIIELGAATPFFYEFDLSAQGESINKESNLKQIAAKVRLKVEIKQKSLYYKNSLVSINSSFPFKTTKYAVEVIPEIRKDMEEKLIDIDITLKDLDGDTLRLISVGDKELDKDSRVIAEILQLTRVGPSNLDIDLNEGYFVTAGSSGKEQVTGKMRLRCQINKSNQFYFKGVRLQYNLPFKFETAKYKVSATVAKSYELISPLKKKWMSLQVKFSQIIPEIATIIHKDDISKDSSGNVIGRINSIISDQQTLVMVVKEGGVAMIQHPLYKDIVASIDVQCAEKDGIYYYNNYAVKIGNPISFYSDLYSITGTIIGLESK